ncbi:MAG: hypothetical protein ABI900_13660 [Betaproteobacteria bacterium]
MSIERPVVPVNRGFLATSACPRGFAGTGLFRRLANTGSTEFVYLSLTGPLPDYRAACREFDLPPR